MPDHARSTDSAVQAQLDRLWVLSPGADILGLDRITAVLARVGDPHLRLPPVFHVAGTNGKGSTCAFLRAALEAAGKRVHVYTSPHLVRFNERIRLAGALIEDAELAPLLAEVLDVGGDIGASFFEVTTAAAFLAFARTPADACVIEVGLGGRLDATNVIPAPVACGMAALGIDHQAFLGDTLDQIAAEKAGIAKPGVPLVTMRYPTEIADIVARVADAAGAPVLAEGKAWNIAPGLFDDGNGLLPIFEYGLRGEHQLGNLGLAAAMLRAQSTVAVPSSAIIAAASRATWPARLQRLASGPLVDLLPDEATLWLDGGHNPSAGKALATALHEIAPRRRVTLVLGMLANKDAAGFLAPLAGRLARLIAVPVPGHDHQSPDDLATIARRLGVAETATAPDLPAALAIAAALGVPEGSSLVAYGSDPRRLPPPVLIAGSLYIAGVALALNDQAPT